MRDAGVSRMMNRKLFFVLVVLVLSLLSSFKIFDNYVKDYTDDAIKAAAITYATARGINAIVSVLQTSTVEAGVFVSGSVSIGELLDPINDLVERFSTVMTFVLGSLVAQKLLLILTSNDLFAYTIGFIGLLSVMAIYFRSPLEKSIALKIFVLLAFIRFSLGLMVGLNTAVDHLLLKEETRRHNVEIVSFKNEFNLNAAKRALKDEGDTGYFKKFEIKVENTVESFMSLMILFLLKSIIFPLIFFYLLLVGVKAIWRFSIMEFSSVPKSMQGG